MSDPQPELGPAANDSVTMTDFQRLIRDMYYEKDLGRGVSGTFMWLMEEVGELSTALRETSSVDSKLIEPAEMNRRRQNLQAEFADVLAWLATIANLVGVDLNTAIQVKYGSGCPGCEQFICVCPDCEKP